MNTKVRQESQNHVMEAPQMNPNEHVDFDLWARAVKRQMIAALSKRGVTESPNS